MKKRILLLLCAAMAFSLFSCSSESPKGSGAPDETPSQEVQCESPSPEPSNEPSAPAVTEPAVTPTEGQAISLDALCETIETVLEDKFSGCSVTHDDSMITVGIWTDGIAMEIGSAAGKLPEGWKDLREGMISLSNSIRNLIDTSGWEDIPALLHLLNDLNHDKVFLSILDGAVIYDVTDEGIASTTAPAQASAPAEAVTTGQRNALSKAKQYLSFMAFSHSGLVDQLKYEGYTEEEATYGADNCGADWNAQAAKKARSYIDLMAFSRQGLIDQLEYDGFTQSEATYGADSCGADWNEQAAKKAQSYLDLMNFSRQGLIDQLKYDGFTQAQAEYGVSAAGY